MGMRWGGGEVREGVQDTALSKSLEELGERGGGKSGANASTYLRFAVSIAGEEGWGELGYEAE